jgi:hypothetical protein
METHGHESPEHIRADAARAQAGAALLGATPAGVGR